MNNQIVVAAKVIAKVAVANYTIEDLLWIASKQANRTAIMFADNRIVEKYWDIELLIDILLECYQTSRSRNKLIISNYLGKIYLPPIILALFNECSLLAIKLNDGECYYLYYPAIAKIKRLNYQQTRIVFYQGSKIDLNCNVRKIMRSYRQLQEFWAVYNENISSLWSNDTLTEMIVKVDDRIVDKY